MDLCLDQQPPPTFFPPATATRRAPDPEGLTWTRRIHYVTLPSSAMLVRASIVCCSLKTLSLTQQADRRPSGEETELPANAAPSRARIISLKLLISMPVDSFEERPVSVCRTPHPPPAGRSLLPPGAAAEMGLSALKSFWLSAKRTCSHL